jgi:hypothetical protein
MTNGDGRNLKMGFEDWDIIGQGTASLTPIAAVVTEQAEGDKYVTSSLVPPFTKAARTSIREDLQVMCVTNLSKDRKRFYLFATQLDLRTKFLTFYDNKQVLPQSWKDVGNGFLAMEFKSFYSEIQDTQVDVLHQDVSAHQPSALSDLYSDRTSMDNVTGRAKCLHESAAGAP